MKWIWINQENGKNDVRSATLKMSVGKEHEMTLLAKGLKLE